MAKSIVQGLVEAGRVQPEETPAARRDAEWKAKQRAEADELEARMAEPMPRTPFEAPATGRIVEQPPVVSPKTRKPR